MSHYALTYPFEESAVRRLRAGDTVSITGTLFTGRDRFHKFLGDGNSAPVNLRNGAIFHCGPVVRQDPDTKTWSIVAAGPTTSCREEPYMAKIIAEQGLRLILGKGGMEEKTLEACRKYGCVYLQVVGGAAALLASRIIRVSEVRCLEEFGATEACWTLEVKDFPALVGMDSHGKSLFADVKNASRPQFRS